jgi:arginyl-tRNA synthetase
LIYLWGSDHHGAVKRLVAAAHALGFDPANVEVLLMQKVSLSGRTGSKRAGVYVSLDELIDEVGVDAARYTFLTRSIDVPLDFDIDLVKQQAPENPVYYVQYAHARICSILRKAEDEGLAPDPTANLDRLVHASEMQLMRKLASYEELVPDAAAQRAPQKIAHFVEELASDFSAFYRDCRVVTDDPTLTHARLRLCVATRNVIANALAILGVGAPERM